MEDGLYEVSEKDLENFAEMNYWIAHNEDALVGDALKLLSGFGNDVRTVTNRMNRLFRDNPLLLSTYRDIYEERTRIIRDVQSVPLAEWASFFGWSQETLRMYLDESINQSKLRAALELETAHIPEFGRDLGRYISRRALANYKQGVLLSPFEFSINPEYEGYIQRSQIAERLYDSVLFEMPKIERIREKDKGNG